MKNKMIVPKRTPSAIRTLPLLGAGLFFAASLSGCSQTSASGKDTVPVQSVSMLTGLDLTGANRYSGVTEARATVKVNKEDGLEVKELKVKVGQEVKKGDVLFTYNTESMDLEIQNAELEIEQLQNSINSYTSQIAQLERERTNAAQSEKLNYTLEIQAQQLEKQETQYNLKQKQSELTKKKEALKKKEEKSEISGIIQSINDPDNSDSDDYYGYGYSSGDAYITIMETGTYRIKGTLNENNVYDIYEGMPMMAISRTDSSLCWKGVVSSVNTDSTEEDDSNNNYYYDSGNSGESSSKYSFYVDLDNSDGLLMGQHVYLVANNNEYEPESSIVLPSSYIIQEGDEAYVWACSEKDTLTKLTVTCGEYFEDLDSYVITEGLTLDDFIAFPDESMAEGRNVVKYDSTSFNTSADDSSEGESEYNYEDGEYNEGEFDEGEFSEGEFDEGEFDEGEGNFEDLDGELDMGEENFEEEPVEE